MNEMLRVTAGVKQGFLQMEETYPQCRQAKNWPKIASWAWESGTGDMAKDGSQWINDQGK